MISSIHGPDNAHDAHGWVAFGVHEYHLAEHQVVGEYGSAAAQHRGRLAWVVVLTAVYMVVEVVGGLLTNSLALLADAGHMATDVFASVLALAAIWLGERPATARQTYGYQRVEVLAALANAIFLFMVCGAILWEAWRRFQDVPEVKGLPMLAVAAVGILVNLVAMAVLRRAAEQSLNIQAAFLHIVFDLLGSLAAVAAAAIIAFTGWYYADPLLSVLIDALILISAWRLVTETVKVLLEGTPSQVDLAHIRAALEEVPGVDKVHDLHVWTITSGYLALTAHARLSAQAHRMETLTALHEVARMQFDIQHCTIQLEELGYREAPTHA